METPQDIGNMIPTVKVVSSGCNMRCLYCYYHQENQGKIKVISDEVLKNLIAKTLAFSELDPVQFTWHGGEPMLAGISLYERILLIEDELRGDKKIENHIQTNATLISKKWAKFFAQNDFKVGVSVDGPEQVHDHCRLLENGRGSFNLVMRGLENLRAVGIQPGAIALVTKASLGREKEIFDFFVNAEIKRFLLKPCFELSPSGEPTEFSVSSEEFSGFMVNILEIWLERDDPSISVRNLEQMMVGVVGGKPSLCEFSGHCWLCPKVEFDGSVGPCDSLSRQNYKFGNISDSTWEELFQSEGFFQFLSGLEESESTCGDCEWLKNCHNRCSRYCSPDGNGTWSRNIFCGAKKEIFQKLKSATADA
jgi:uncharacterized protein